MSKIEDLKQEFKNQKKLIENVGGVVNVANDYPSPYEITEGIKSIPAIDLTLANATEEDVLQGKTFYAGSTKLKTGHANVDLDVINALFMPMKSEPYNGSITYSVPTGMTILKNYAFYNNSNTVHIIFNDELQNINEYAFANTPNFTFENFDDLNLTYLDSYCFYNSSCNGMNAARLPDTIKTMGSCCFCNVNFECLDFKFPDSLTSMGTSNYKQNYGFRANSLDLTNIKITTLSGTTFQNVFFNCDLIIPEGVKGIGSSFNFNGCFHNISIPSTITLMQSNCFGNSTDSPVSDFYTKTITINKETPPTIQANCFSTHSLTNGLKIYVPDTAVEAYKAVTNLKYCADNILPMSQKP